MQMSDAMALSKKWGNKACSHPNLEKEYHLGANTGDWVCTTCGACFPSRDIDKSKEEK